MGVFLRHEKRAVCFLDGIWDFVFLGQVKPEEVQTERLAYNDRLPVPSAYDAYPKYAGKRGVAAYRTFLTVPAGQGALLRFRGTGMWSRILVDGQLLREISLPYSQFEVLLPAAEQTTRELVVLNDNRYDLDRVPLQMNHFDFYGYGGIYRSVELHLLPEVWLEDVRLTPQSAASGEVRANFAVNGLQEGTLPVQIAADGKQVFHGETHIRGGRGELTFRVPQAREWSAAQPHLHLIHLQTPQDDFRERIGFRTIDVSTGVFRINGKEEKLLGYCRHEAHPQFGPALPVAQMAQDLQLLRGLGCNFIRGSHYPQDPDFLDLCDELGFYVFEEALGWGAEERQFLHPDFLPRQLEQTRLMVRKSYNRPCVILWGFLNEGRANDERARPVYRELAATLRAEDQTRPVSYASMHPYDDLFREYADVISINTYPGWYAHNNEEYRPLEEIETSLDKILAHMKATGHGEKPFILSEIGAGAIYGWHDPLRAHWTEEYQADYLDIVCRRVRNDERICGVSLWQFCDGRTYASSRALGRPRAFNNKGTFDEYRRPKMAAQTVRKWFAGE